MSSYALFGDEGSLLTNNSNILTEEYDNNIVDEHFTGVVRNTTIQLLDWCPLVLCIELNSSGGQGDIGWFALDARSNNPQYVKISSASNPCQVVFDAAGITITVSTSQYLKSVRGYNYVHFVSNSPRMYKVNSSTAILKYAPSTYYDGTKTTCYGSVPVYFPSGTCRVYNEGSCYVNGNCSGVLGVGVTDQMTRYVGTVLTSSNSSVLVASNNALCVGDIIINASQGDIDWDINHYAVVAIDTGSSFDEYYCWEGKWGASNSDYVQGTGTIASEHGEAYFARTLEPWGYWDSSAQTFRLPNLN